MGPEFAATVHRITQTSVLTDQPTEQFVNSILLRVISEVADRAHSSFADDLALTATGNMATHSRINAERNKEAALARHKRMEGPVTQQMLAAAPSGRNYPASGQAFPGA